MHYFLGSMYMGYGTQGMRQCQKQGRKRKYGIENVQLKTV
ncbi:hypothetical protein SLEP1_g36931 [Rubroshorea leprosula]|uniref:Uncharacterized protein n=1 Tax=Rubroshorea leprosula TaxID=152421 RepID=A0AAV5KT41_9ROSI|nr:hypothetical protein SLEP1_g36931 [Rubroshorea leprosula]